MGIFRAKAHVLVLKFNAGTMQIESFYKNMEVFLLVYGVVAPACVCYQLCWKNCASKLESYETSACLLVLHFCSL